MNAEKKNTLGPVFFCYAAPAGFSGQKEATEIIVRGLSARGWDCRRLAQPVLERDRGGIGSFLRFAFGLLAAWLRAGRMFFAPRGTLAVNLGLTKMAFLRDGLPLLLGRLVFGRDRVIVSLHGSLFMGWPDDSWNARWFCRLLRQAGLVTVLGHRQRARLLALGIEEASVEIVINSCSLAALPDDQLYSKIAAMADARRPLRVLHLGSLIATKGFPEYLEALEVLAGRDGRAVEAVLCGKITASEFQDRFPNGEAAGRWIEETMARINRRGRVAVRWVRGAVGEEKAALFRAADVFVLPTRYAVEAQPLVLLEAMASGCAIVTTPIGEIPTILDDASALFLGASSASELVAALGRCATEPALIDRLARTAHRRFRENYDLDHHLAGWATRLAARRAPLPAATEPVFSKS